MPLLEMRLLRKTYGSGELCVEALRGIDLKVEQGEFLAIMGPSGSGKSTLLYMLGGVDRATSGQVLLQGTDLTVLSDDQRTILRRQRIGFIFQSFNLLPALNAEENVSLPLELNGTPTRKAQVRADAALEMVGMLRRRTHLPSMLSGGEQQRVAIARALVIEPALLLADEPTGNLDTTNGRQVTTLLRQLVNQQQQTIVMVTHDPGIAAHADRLICLRDGLIASDSDQTPVSYTDELVAVKSGQT